MAASASGSLLNKKRKSEEEMRVFKSSRTEDFFVVEHFGWNWYLICQETITVIKEYNIKRHYTTQQAIKFDNIVSQQRTNHINLVKQSIISQQSFLKVANKSSKAETKVNFLIAESIDERIKQFSDKKFNGRM